MTRRFRGLGLLWLALLASCGQPSGAPSASGVTLRAVTTMSVLADVIRQVGGERVAVQNVIPLGAGAEDYQPTPQDAQVIARADVLFFNGHGLESWLDDLFESAGKPGLRRVELSAGLPALDVDGAAFQGGNPHFWLNPQHVISYVAVIRDTLGALDPAGTADYTARAARYTAELQALDSEIAAQIATIPAADRKMVTNHDAFPYFAQRYGLTVIGNILGNPEAEPAAGDLAALVQRLRAAQVKAVFTESQYSPKLVQTIAAETGISVVANLYTNSLGSDAATGSYVAMMRYDVATIVSALRGQP